MAAVFWAAGICLAHASIYPTQNFPNSGNTDQIQFGNVTHNSGQGFGAVTNLLTLHANPEEAGSITPAGDVNIIGGTGWLSDTGGGQDNFILATRSAPVPLPPAIWLMGSGLLGLIGIRRRFRK
jgi:hypothetical protein